MNMFTDDAVVYVSLSFYLSGLLLGSLMFGWFGCQIRQRKYLLLIGTCASILAGGAFMVSIEYWMLFPANFLQGISNASIWLMCTALIADIWPHSKWGSMIGFILSTYPLGMSLGLTLGGGMMII